MCVSQLVPSAICVLTIDYNMFWRQSLDDGVYGPEGSLVRSGEGSRERLEAVGAHERTQPTGESGVVGATFSTK